MREREQKKKEIKEEGEQREKRIMKERKKNPGKLSVMVPKAMFVVFY